MVFGKHINRYYAKYWYLMILGFVMLMTVDMLQLIIPNLYQMLINGLNEGRVLYQGEQVQFDLPFLTWKICMPMVGIILGVAAGRIAWRFCFMGAAIRMETDLRNRMFGNARRLSRDYYQVNKVGGLMSLFTNDLDTVQECFGQGIVMCCDAVILFILAMRKMIGMDPLLTVLSMIPMALLLFASATVGRYMMKKWDYRQQCFSQLSDFAQESFSGIAVIKAFVREARELLAFRRINRENERANVEYTRLSVLLQVLVNAFVESVICVILGYGGYLVYTGRFNAGQLMEFIGYFSSVIWPVIAVSQLVDMTSRGKASLTRIGTLLDAEPTVTDRPGVGELRNVRGEIEFRSLTFRYPGSENAALDQISFKIRAGEKIGIIGRTGGGKTTLVDLILRTCNVPDGTLFIDGQDVNTVSIQSVRNACAYVPQDNFLFSDTIENNISFGMDGPDHEKAERAAKLADIHGDIMEFSRDYQTVLGERGVTVSGGQKQRISIARALMKDAPILILDDSVSAVDTRTEKMILENLNEIRKDKTTLLIAHRVSTIKSMDRILLLDNGRLTACGTHEELMAHCPEYSRMVNLQRLEEEKEADGNA